MDKEKKVKDPQTTTKRALRLLLINGVLWVWCSYILAFLDKTVIAETLSQVAITEILGAYLVYALKSLFENLSMHNTWPDKGCADIVPPEDNWENAKGDCEGESNG